jgi:hypothetical protein
MVLDARYYGAALVKGACFFQRPVYSLHFHEEDSDVINPFGHIHPRGSIAGW